MTPDNVLRGKGTHNVAQPDLTNQHRVGRNKIWNAFVAICQVRAHADFPIATDFHPHQGMFHTSHCLAASKQGLVADEGDASFDSNHFFLKVFHLFRIQRSLDAFVCVLPRSFSFLKQFETSETFHGISTRAIWPSPLSRPALPPQQIPARQLGRRRFQRPRANRLDRAAA